MIDILGLLMMLMSMTSAIELIHLNSSAVMIVPSVTVVQFPSAFANAEHCHSRSPSVARRDDYTYTPGIGGHKHHAKAAPWNEARLTCEEEGGHLVIINSIAESQAIAKLFEKSPAPPGTFFPDYAYSGFHDFFKNGQWVTIHGEPIAKTGFNEWKTGEPNNEGGNEHCGSVSKHGRLNDLTCNHPARFICEIPMPSV